MLTDEELFILLMQQLGKPKPLMRKHQGMAKSNTLVGSTSIDYLCRFVSVCGAAGRIIPSESELKQLHADYTEWYERQPR